MLVGVLALMPFTGCKNNKDGLKTIEINEVTHSVFYAPLYVAIENGYFEEQNIENFVDKLDMLYPSIRYVTPLTTLPWGQKLVRFYDFDGHLIEVRNISRDEPKME